MYSSIIARLVPLKTYLVNLLVAGNRLVNTALAGNPNMTVSGRMGRSVERGECRLCGALCKLLHLVDKDHCEKQWRREKVATSPPLK